MHKTEEFFKQGLPAEIMTDILKNYDDLGIRRCEAGSPAIMTKIAGTVLSSEKYGRWLNYSRFSAPPERDPADLFQDRNYPIRKDLHFLRRMQLNGRVSCIS
jgi:hypothetical protein